MLKLLGSVLILSGGALAAARQRWEDRRLEETEETCAALLWTMAEEIRMTRTPLPRLLRRLQKDQSGPAADFLGELAAAVDRGQAAGEAWARASKVLFPEGESRQIWLSAGEALFGDEEMICRGLARAAEQLERRREQQRQVRWERGRRRTALDLCGAALLVILLV